MAVNAGSFAKSTGGAPASQAITGVGFQPRALILWTSGATSAGSWQDHIHFGYGYAARNAAGTVTTGSISLADQDAQETSNTGMRIAAKALTIGEYDGSAVLAECDMTSFDADGFTLSWTTNDANAYLIHYMALGGPDFTDAYVKSWTFATSTGDQAVTGVGFQPDYVLHIGATLAGALPQSGVSPRVFIGGMDASAMFCLTFMDRDAQATTSCLTGGTTDRTIWALSTLGLGDYKATYVSLDADGFTVNVDNAAPSATNVLSLCCKGGSYNAAAFYTSATEPPVDQAITGVGFTPEGVLILANGISAASTTYASDITLGVGAMDGTNQNAAHISSEYNAGTSNSAVYDSADKALLYDAAGDQIISVQAGYKSFDADGFTITIDTGGASSGQDIFYFAFAGGAIEEIEPVLALWAGIPALLPGRQVYGSGRGW